jgi:hypothetical protein
VSASGGAGAQERSTGPRRGLWAALERASTRTGRLVALALSAAGIAVLVLDAFVPIFPASAGGEEPAALVADPSAGGGEPADPGFVWVTASAYGGDFVGQETACGEVLEATSRIVAHRTLACGTRIEIRLEGETVDATIGDRGPFEAGRELDLAPGVWSALGFSSRAEFGVRGVQARLG